MGSCYSKKVVIQDFSYCKSVVQAAKRAHSIRNYDKDVGVFTFHRMYFYLQSNGKYACSELYQPTASSCFEV